MTVHKAELDDGLIRLRVRVADDAGPRDVTIVVRPGESARWAGRSGGGPGSPTARTRWSVGTRGITPAGSSARGTRPRTSAPPSRGLRSPTWTTRPTRSW